MRYEELQSLCVEIHSGKCDQSRNYEIQRYLNQWSNNGKVYTACTLKLRPVKLLFVIFGRLSYSFYRT